MIAGRVAAAVLLAAPLAVPACSAPAGPELDSASPASAPRDATIALVGKRLCGPRADCTTAAGEIDLGLQPPMQRATVVSYTDTMVQIIVPPTAPPGATDIIVTVDEEASNALAFTVSQ